MNCGNVAIVGRPNVGKSSLLNCLLDYKVSITSRKPNTTRNAILGIRTTETTQLVFVDTPGWQERPKKLLDKNMNREVRLALNDVDCVLMLADARGWQHTDDAIVSLIDNKVQTVLALNKEDLVKDKTALLREISRINKKHNLFSDFFLISATKRTGIEELVARLMKSCPRKLFLYPPEMITNRTERFLVSELVREKLVRFLGEELPYETKVSVESYRDGEDIARIGCTIWVERLGQKTIVIGRKGSLIKKIGIAARHDIERLVGKRVYIDLWVKVKKGWRDDLNFLEPVEFEG